MNQSMWALRLHERGGPEQLAYEQAPGPYVGIGDALVRVHAASFTPTELDWPSTWTDRQGRDRTPVVPAHEVSGVVAALGYGTSGLSVGDEVFGLTDWYRDGAAAGYVAVEARNLAAKPSSVDHLQAAAVPLAGLTAWQALFDHGHLQAGQTVLVQGAAGGVGTFAVQLARWRGARVVATASARDADLVRNLGAAEVIDYRARRFEDAVTDVDLVFDTVGGDTWERSWGVLRPGGRLVSIAVPRPPEREAQSGRCAIWFVVEPNRAQLIDMERLIDAGHLRPIVSATLPLAAGREAYGPSRNGRGPGKTVLIVAE